MSKDHSYESAHLPHTPSVCKLYSSDQELFYLENGYFHYCKPSFMYTYGCHRSWLCSGQPAKRFLHCWGTRRLAQGMKGRGGRGRTCRTTPATTPRVRTLWGLSPWRSPSAQHLETNSGLKPSLLISGKKILKSIHFQRLKWWFPICEFPSTPTKELIIWC